MLLLRPFDVNAVKYVIASRQRASEHSVSIHVTGAMQSVGSNTEVTGQTEMHMYVCTYVCVGVGCVHVIKCFILFDKFCVCSQTCPLTVLYLPGAAIPGTRKSINN